MIVKSAYDIIWFRVVVVTLCTVGIVTPPVGTNLFVAKGLVGEVVSTNVIIKGTSIFLRPLTLGLVLIIAFPEIFTFLISFMSNLN